MAKTVYLDAMIERADFAIKGSDTNFAEPIQALSIENLGPNGMVVPMLRKPDFQRETNHWSPPQVLKFLESFLDQELIPSVILWRSDAHLFAIDGAHRLSALRAWIEDDYGDGLVSLKFYSNEISTEQRKAAATTRKLVEENIGKYSQLKKALIEPDNYEPLKVRRARNMAIRTISLQWVQGDGEKAETSFFNINTQGTALDEIEGLLLKNRDRSVAIAARSIVRAGTGYKYWSKYNDSKPEIERLSKILHALLFNPEVEHPIKTLELPLGGTQSPIHALALLMNFLAVAGANHGSARKQVSDFPIETDGSETIKLLEYSTKIVGRMVGNAPGSLGLHPAVYFYSDNGRRLPDLLMGMVTVFKKYLDNNNPTFFKRFTSKRASLEELLVSKKSLITQALHLGRSKIRVERAAAMFEFLISQEKDLRELSEGELVKAIMPSADSKILSFAGSPSKDFSHETKSQIYLRESIINSLKCPICKGLMLPSQSVSYDHITRVQDGGLGHANNGQLTHPFCNTGIKN